MGASDSVRILVTATNCCTSLRTRLHGALACTPMSHPVVNISSDGSGNPELARQRVLGAVGEVSCLEEVRAGGEGTQVSLCVHDGQVAWKTREKCRRHRREGGERGWGGS